MFNKKDNTVEILVTLEKILDHAKSVIEANGRLIEENRRLREQLEKQDDDPHIIYECDKQDCEDGCNNPECFYTTNIEHAANFHKVLDGMYEENRRNF